MGWIQVGKTPKYHPLRSNSLGSKSKPLIGFVEVPFENNIKFLSFTDGCLEGARALKDLIKHFSNSNQYDFNSITQSVFNIGEEFVLQDDKTLVFIETS